MPYSIKGFFEIGEDMVQILLVLEVLFTQDSEVEDLFCGASFGSEPMKDPEEIIALVSKVNKYTLSVSSDIFR